MQAAPRRNSPHATPDEQLRLAVVVGSLRAGGAERQAVLTARELARRGHAVHLITLAFPREDFYGMPEGVRRIALDLGQPSSSILQSVVSNVRRVRALSRALKACAAEMVIAFAAETAAVSALALPNRRVRLIASERTDPRVVPMGTIWRTLRRRAYRRADCLVSNSQDVCEHLASEFPLRRVERIPNILDMGRLVAGGTQSCFDLSLLGSAPLIVSVGRLDQAKNQRTLLEAFSRLKQAPLPVLVLAGEGDMRADLERMARDLGVADRVHLPGVVSNMSALYERACILGFPSLFEGFPNVVLEALACDCAVVAADTATGASELIQHDEQGLLIAPQDVNAWTSALAELLGDEPRRSRLTRAGILLADQFSPTVIGDRWNKLVLKLARRSSGLAGPLR